MANGIPSHDTFNRFFSLFNPQKFQDLFLGWLHELICLSSTAGKQVAIDGKSNRGSGTGKKKMLHLLHAYLVENECLLAQKKTEDKSNEITAIPILLDAAEQGQFYYYRNGHPFAVNYDDPDWSKKQDQYDVKTAGIRKDQFQTYFEKLRQYTNTKTSKELQGSCSYYADFLSAL